MKRPQKTRLVQMLERAIDKDGGSQVRFAARHRFSQQTLSTWMNGRVPTRQFHDRLAAILNVSDDMMAELIDEAEERRPSNRLPPANGTFRPAPPASMSDEPPVPVYGQAVGGDGGEYLFNGQVLDWVGRPPSLAGVTGAYAVFVDGESMVPAYKPGQTVWVHPTRPPRRGDDVVVQLHGEYEGDAPRGYIKEFVGWTPTKLVLQQHNPAGKVEFGRESVKTVGTIVFSERA